MFTVAARQQGRLPESESTQVCLYDVCIMQGYLVAENAEESRQVGLIEYLAVSGQDVRPWVQPDLPAGADPGRGL